MDRRMVASVLLLTALLASGCAGETGERPEENNVNDTEDDISVTYKNWALKYGLPGDVSEETADATAEVARNRMEQQKIKAQVSAYKNSTWRIQITTRNGNVTDIKELMSPRSFSAVFNYSTSGEDLRIDRNYSVTVGKDSVTISGEEVEKGETEQIAGTSVEVEEVENGEANLLVQAYGPESIRKVMGSTLSLRESSGDYRYSFSVALEQEAAERVMNLSRNFQTIDGGGRFLAHEDGDKARLYYYVDGNLTNSLKVSSVFKKQPIINPAISGSGETEQQAREEALNLIRSLRSGTMPAKPELLNVTKFNT